MMNGTTSPFQSHTAPMTFRAKTRARDGLEMS